MSEHPGRTDYPFTLEDIRPLISYDPETGEFTWNLLRKKGAAGSLNRMGYRAIKLFGVLIQAHRLAWFMTHGHWPSMIDHINGDRGDNRIVNLRLTNKRLNGENQRKPRPNNKCGYLGVRRPNRCKQWVATIKSKGAVYYLGAYPTPELAHEAYIAAKRKLHEGCSI